MYIPAAFRESNTARLHEFMREHSFALLTSHSACGLVASHLPLLVDATRGSLGTLAGHFAKANEQVADAGAESLAVFSGPHAYISPTWYQTPNTVPTWNYVAVHAYGVLRLIEDKAHTAHRLEQMIEKSAVDKSKTNWRTTLKKPDVVAFETGRSYFIRMQTNKGSMKIKLMPDVAPMHATNFIYLTKLGFFDGLTFHRVITNFMAQGGDPLGTAFE